MAASDRVRVGMYGAGGHAVTQHLPNLKSMPAAEVVAVCDIDGDKARSAASEFDIPAAYTDGLEMVEKESLDALWSLVPAAARPAVEIAAAGKGAHLFCEKPQALDMEDRPRHRRRPEALGPARHRLLPRALPPDLPGGETAARRQGDRPRPLPEH